MPRTDPPSVVAILPALDEVDSLPGVLRELAAQPVDRVIVVDGGSSDGTVEAARAAGAEVIVDARRGYGRALLAGLAACPEASVYVFLDADGADDPADLPRLIRPILDGQADLVLGRRPLGPTMPLHQRLGNGLCAMLIRLVYGAPIHDLAPFRAIRGELLHHLALREQTHGLPTEMLVKALSGGHRVLEVEVGHRRREHGRSKISGTLRGTVLAAFHILRVTALNAHRARW